MTKVAAILLAAGESRRMGTPKPLLAWGGRTLIEYQLDQLRQAGCDPVIVVLGPGADELQPLVEGATVVINERYADGRSSSVIAGAEALPPEVGAVVILNVDEPRPSWVLRRLVDEHITARPPVTRPVFLGQRGHPPIIDSAIFPELLTLREETRGLRAVMDRYDGEILRVEFDDPLVRLGMNTPVEYEAALRVFGERESL